MNYQKFKDFIALKEGATITGRPQDVDTEIMQNPQMLAKGNPTAGPLVNAAIQNKRQNPRVSLDAAMKAAQMSQKMKQQPGAGGPGMPQMPQPGGGMR